MPPPPLTDEEVRQCVQKCWDEGREDECLDVLGILVLAPEKGCLPVDVAPDIYRREWDRAYRYGLADDAMASILAKLEAPADPNTPLAEVLDWEDEPRLRRAIEQMCDIDDIDYFIIVIRSPWQLKFSARLLLYASIPLFLLLALLTRHPWWSVGSVVCYLILWLFRENSALIGTETRQYQIHPSVTFAQLAESIQETAQNRGEEMQEAAGRFRQTEIQEREY